MGQKGYTYEEKFVRTVRNWRRACDERGLSSLQRSKFNYRLLNLILDELMAWYTKLYDFSLLEVNRDSLLYMQVQLLGAYNHYFAMITTSRTVNVLGFTKETVYALTTGIESVEWKRREYAGLGCKPETPRSSTTDDVECMFSIMRDLRGKHFTLREARYTWRKCCIEFAKRLDPDIGFYYFSSSHDHFYEGERPHFDEMPLKTA